MPRARRASTSKDATAAVEEQLSSGMKDEAQGVLDALQEVFWAERKGRKNGGGSKPCATACIETFRNLKRGGPCLTEKNNCCFKIKTSR